VSGWNWGFLAPFTVAGVARASGDFRLAVALSPSDDPHSLVLIGRVATGGGAGAASSVLARPIEPRRHDCKHVNVLGR